MKIFQSRQKAYTMVEALISIFILSVVALTFMYMFSSAFQVYRYDRNRISSMQTAAAAMRNFEQTTRGLEKTTQGATSLTEATANSLTFLAYQRGDDFPAPSKIRFWLDNGTFYKYVIPPVANGEEFDYPDANRIVTTVATHVTNVTFSYYNEASLLLSAPIQADVVRMIGFQITVNLENGTSGATESTYVELRNLKTNL